MNALLTEPFDFRFALYGDYPVFNKGFKEGFEQFVAFVHLFFFEVKRSSGSAFLNLLFLAYSIQNQLL
jgi:hypothetical protein